MDQGRSRKHVEALHLRIKEYRQELALCKKEAKRAAKALKHAEVRLNCTHTPVRVSAGLSPPASACLGMDQGVSLYRNICLDPVIRVLLLC